MLEVIIALSLLGYLIFGMLRANSQKSKKQAYQWWYMPWLCLLFVVLAFVSFRWFNNKGSLLSSSASYEVETLFFLWCYGMWLVVLRPVLRLLSKPGLRFYRKNFADKEEHPEKALPFPYYLNEAGELKARVGLTFYRWTLKVLLLMVGLVYAVAFVLVGLAHIHFFPLSVLGLLGLLPIIEYYIYLNADATTEEEAVKTKTQKPSSSDFDMLWRAYTETFDDYAVAWKKAGLKPEEVERWETDNNNEMEALLKGFRDSQSDIIIENYDLATAFVKLEPLFDEVEKNGKYVLIALDIPKYFTKDLNRTYVEEIAKRLGEILKKSFFVYQERLTKETLNNSVVIASLPTLTRQGMNEEWMRRIGLVAVLNVFDKGVSNMYECRKFCYILESMNEDYQVVFVTPYRRGMEPSIRNTWITGSNVIEKKMRQFPVCAKRFFIGYHFEDFSYRRNLVFKSLPPEPIYSGSEMFCLALSSSLDGVSKAVTPVHNLELSYTNAIEGKEELGKFNDFLVSRYTVSKSDVSQHVKCHLLPVVRIDEKQVFAVVFDQENNAPAVYAKWMHLGSKENFTIVISKPYLFRDYFNANHDYFVAMPFAALQPKLCKSRVTLAIILFNMLHKAEMEERELRTLLGHYYVEEELVSVAAIIRQLFTTYFSNNLADMLVTTEVTDFDGERYLHKTIYWLDITDDFSLPYLDVVTVEDESGNVLFDLLRDLMDQNYAVNQIHSFSGKPYKILGFNKRNKTLNVSSINNSNADVCFYKPIQTVGLTGDRKGIEGLDSLIKFNHHVTGEELSLRFEGFETEVKVEVREWCTFHKYSVMGTGSHRRDASDPPRVYRNGKVLKVSFGFLRKKEYLRRIDDIRKGLQLLLYEAMQSVFPEQAQYLLIASLGEGDPDLPWIFNRFECGDTPEEGVLSYYFIEDAHIDLGLIGALSDKENLWYLFRYLYDYLNWLTEGTPVMPVGYDAYLYRNEADRFEFLKYGRDHLPAYFDVELLMNFIADFYEKNEELQHEVGTRQGKQEFVGVCDFCARPMKNSEMQRLTDGRMRCRECSEGAVDTIEQFGELYKAAKEMFKIHLGIDFAGIPHQGRLTTAVELHRLNGDPFDITNGYDARKVLGLTCSGTEEVFYVEDGYKPEKTFGIIVHELTHVWQNHDAGFQKLKAGNALWVEGLAVWTDLYLSEKFGIDVSGKLQAWLSRNDDYGRGLKFIMDTCPSKPYWYIKLHAK